MGARWSESFPVSGMTHNGNLYPLQALVPRTSDGDGGAWHIPSPTVSDLYTGNLASTQQSEDTNHSVTLPQWAERYPTPQAADGSDVETGFGLRDYVNHKRKYMLPTPTVSGAPDSGGPPNKNANTTMWDGVNSLGQMAKQGRWPTPQASDVEGGINTNVELENGSFSRRNANGTRWGVKLRDAVAHTESKQELWPTPTKNVNADCPSERDRHTPALESAVNIEDQTKGKLSASWVEWLMGLPEGWASKEPLAPGNKAKWDELASLAMWWDEERGLPRVVEDQVDRVPRLKTLGNGIVPMCIPIFLRVYHPQIALETLLKAENAALIVLQDLHP